MITLRITFLASIALVLLACGDPTQPDAHDDAGLPCAPSITAMGEYECPTGCIALEGEAFDPERQCGLGRTTVVACHPEAGSTLRSGDLACLERDGTPYAAGFGSVATWTSDDGVTVDLLETAGWRRCAGSWVIPPPPCAP